MQIKSSESLQNLTFYARIIFAVQCLENLKMKYRVDINTDVYQYLKNLIWLYIEIDLYSLTQSYTLIDEVEINNVLYHSWNKYINKWLVEYSNEEEERIISEYIKSIPNYKCNLTVLNNKMDKFKDYYNRLPKDIVTFYDNLFELIHEDTDSNSRYHLDKILELMVQNNVELPELYQYRKYMIFNNWIGKPISREDFENNK